MAENEKKYKFLLIRAFRLPSEQSRANLPKEKRLKNYSNLNHLLKDVDWELSEGGLATYGDWKVENREEFCYSAAARIKIVRESCESGRYNAIVLLGGGDPGFLESREISRKYGVVVTACGFSQMHIASMLGNKFSVIDFAESHNMYYYNLIIQHRFEKRCASIRSLNYYHPRPGYKDEDSLEEEEKKALRGERSEAVERAVEAAVEAIEKDGAEVITFGCSGVFWLQPFLQKRLNDMGWEVPVLEGYSCAIGLAKLFVDLGLNASGLAFPGDRPKKWRRKKSF